MEEENNTAAEPEEEGTVSGNDPVGTEPTEPEPAEPDDGKDSKTPAPEKPEEGRNHDGQENGSPDQEDRQTGQTATDPSAYTEMIAEALAGLEHPDNTGELTSRLDAVIQLLTPQEEEALPAAHSDLSMPPSGYTDYEYPASVTYGITTATGYSTYVSMEYDSADAFRAGFEKMEADVSEGSLRSFYVRYVRGLDGEGFYSVMLYDSENPVTVPGSDEPEENETARELLSRLEGMDVCLADMAAADLEYYEACADYRQEMLELRTAGTAGTIILCIAVFMLAGLVMVKEFFGRVK